MLGPLDFQGSRNPAFGGGMGIDTQKGLPVPKQPIEPTAFDVNPWFRRPTNVGTLGEDSTTEDSAAVPSVVVVRCDDEARTAPPGVAVFIVSRNPNSAEILVSDPNPRRLGVVGGPDGERLARLCTQNVGGIMGTVLPGAVSEVGHARIQLNVR